MKAAVYKKYGPPSVISIEDIAKPKNREGEILVRVYTSTVNRTDTGFRSARYVVSRLFSGLLKPKYQILGTEFAGEVVRVGVGVQTFAVGDRICGYNEKTFGTNAEFVAISEDGMVAKIPDNLSYEEAAPLLEGSHYAKTYIDYAEISSDDRVLVYGASGAIGTAAVQILAAGGADVTAVCGTKNISLVKGLGARDVLDYQTTNFLEVLSQEKRKFNYVIDAVGKLTFSDFRHILTADGVYMSTELGPYLQNIFLPLVTKMMGGQRVFFPLPSETKEDVREIMELVEDGKYRAVIDRTYQLDDIVAATEYVESESKTGSVVIVH